MEKTINGYKIIAEDDVWERIDSDCDFNTFIGKCMSHFVHFVIPRRDQTQEIEQDYNYEGDVLFFRRDLNNGIFISSGRW